MLKRILVLPAALFLSQAVLAQPAQKVFPDSCDNGVPFPFKSIEHQHLIDTGCPSLSGQPKSAEISHIQNKVKNNFCADATKPELVTPNDLILLQDTAFKDPFIKAHTGQQKEPKDRTRLTKLGEGKVVRMKAFLVEAHFADIPPLTGESVNCKDLTKEGNDIHMALVAARGMKECESVSAEILPHYRPLTWAEIGNFKDDAKIATRLQAQTYRITGQRFYDASHTPCGCTVHCSPDRSSDWEIHPVYSIEVCKAGAACDETKDSDWVDFDTWWKSPPAKPATASPPAPGRHKNK